MMEQLKMFDEPEQLKMFDEPEIEIEPELSEHYVQQWEEFKMIYGLVEI